MRPRWFPRAVALAAGLSASLWASSQLALAQVQVTPIPTTTPSVDTGCTGKLGFIQRLFSCQWTMWMGIGAVVVGVLLIVAFALAYLRVAPTFFGRERGGRAPTPGPGYRPPQLARQAQAMRPQPAAASHPAPAPAAVSEAPTAARTATSVAERPEEPATAAQAGPAPAPVAEPATEGHDEPTAQPEPEPTPAETAAAPAPTVSHGTGTEMDQETYDRVLQEQISKGLSQRVAEGRARAAAVRAAREKAGG